jgi:hypothetical protein
MTVRQEASYLRLINKVDGEELVNSMARLKIRNKLALFLVKQYLLMKTNNSLICISKYICY